MWPKKIVEPEPPQEAYVPTSVYVFRDPELAAIADEMARRAQKLAWK